MQNKDSGKDLEQAMRNLLQEFMDQGLIEDEDMAEITPEEEAFAREIYNIFQEIVDEEERLTEEFTSNNSLKNHYKKHCLCGRSDRKSTKSKIYYDFDNINDYKDYENFVTSFIDSTDLRIKYLGDDNINKYFRKLFEGNQAVYFTGFCDFRNSNGLITILVHAFASDKTQNYKNGNTLNFTVLQRNKTVTMFPVDAHYLQTKLNNVIIKYSKSNYKLNFNND